MLRQKLIEAASRVYGEYGFRGATTRRIAEEAGVNEVTLFRHFGSKEALIAEVVRHCAVEETGPRLPDVPVHPERELTEWAAAHLAHLRGSRALIRKTMGEMEERPETACAVSASSQEKARTLKRYMWRLAEHGFVRWSVASPSERDEEAHAAGAMLMSALFADAMGRDMMPEMYPQPATRAAGLYVKVFLRAIACAPAEGRAAARGGAKKSAVLNGRSSERGDGRGHGARSGAATRNGDNVGAAGRHARGSRPGASPTPRSPRRATEPRSAKAARTPKGSRP